MKNKVINISILFSLVFGIVLPLPAFAHSVEAEELIILTNQSRRKYGLTPLLPNLSLSEAAKLKGEDMLLNDYFAHTSPNGLDPWSFFKKVDYEYSYAGENLAIDFDQSNPIHEAWMKSDSHRKNILNPEYVEIGIAVLEGDFDGRNTVVVVELFGKQKNNPIFSPEVAAARDKLIQNNAETPLKVNILVDNLELVTRDGQFSSGDKFKVLF